MSKRSGQFERRDRDFYPTPESAVIPLVPHLPCEFTTYWEPCAGDGALIRALANQWRWGSCTRATDIEPQWDAVVRRDCMTVKECLPKLIITNPPWPRPGGGGEPVIGMIHHLASMSPTWLLLPHDFSANRYFGKVSSLCAKIVPVGRVSWMGNGTPGKDNAAWYLFDVDHIGFTRFCARAA